MFSRTALFIDGDVTVKRNVEIMRNRPFPVLLCSCDAIILHRAVWIKPFDVLQYGELKNQDLKILHHNPSLSAKADSAGGKISRTRMIAIL